MTSNTQFRRWLQATAPAQLFATLGAAAVATTFVVASVVAAPGGTAAVAVGAPTPGGGVAGGASTTGGEGVPGAASGADGSPVHGGAPAAQSGGSAGAAGGQPSGGVTAGPSAADVPLVASDRGVTEDTITLGALTLDDALANSGFSPNQRNDTDQYVEALAAYLNERGGVVGRRVEMAVRRTDPTSTSDQDAACQSMLNDRKVFGVLDLALSNGPAQACIAHRGQTPYAHLSVWSQQWQAKSGGYDVGYAPAIDRVAKAMVRDLSSSGWLTSDSVIGVFGDNCPTTKPTVDSVLVPLLKGTGARVEVGLHDCTIAAVLQQPPNIATRFRTAGVDHVISVANYVSMQVFLQAASGLGGWSPEYAVSDWFSGVSDSGSANFDPDQFDGAVGLTTTRTPLLNAGRPGHPGVERCNEAAVEAGLEPLGGPETDTHLVLCDLFFLMVDGIAAAGPNPTRALWASAVPALGTHQSTIWGRASFAAGKTNGADELYTARWHRDCRCWKAESDMRRIDG